MYNINIFIKYVAFKKVYYTTKDYSKPVVLNIEEGLKITNILK